MFEKNLIILPDATFETKEDVIRYLTHLDNPKVTDGDLYEKDVRERESVMPTYVGYSIGLPHARTAAVTEPFVIYARLKNNVFWGSVEEEEANQVFLIGVPAENGDGTASNLHLKILAMLSRKLVHEEFRNTLLNAKTKDEILKVLKSIEEEN